MKLSPEALALAAFTFVVSQLIGGWQHVAGLVAGVLGPVLPFNGLRPYALLTAAVVIALSAGAGVVGARAAAVTDLAWARAFGQASVVVAGIVCAAAVVYAVGSFTGEGMPYFLPR